MSILAISLFTLAGALALLAIWMFTKYQSGPAVRYYGLFLLALGGITVSQGILFNTPTPDQALFWGKAANFFGVITFSFLLLFTYYFPFPAKKIPSPKTLFFVPVILFGILIFGNNNFLQVEVSSSGEPIESRGSLFWIFIVFVVLYASWAIRNLARKLQQNQAVAQRSIRVFILVLIFAAFSGVLFDVVLPALGMERIPVGIYSSGILFGLSAYIVTRK